MGTDVRKNLSTVESAPSATDVPGGRSGDYLIVGLILLVASVLILSNLGNQYLWQDEAQTACISKTVLQYGVPHGYDGRNFFSQQFGAEYGSNYVWRWHTWLSFYVLAGFFAAFGESTFVCRLPFALFAIATVLMAYLYGKSLWQSRRVGILAAALMIANVPLLLLARQCRYYSMAGFFTLAALYAYSELLKGRKWAGAGYVVASCLLFHTFYVYQPAVLAAAIIHASLYHRDRLKQVILLSAIALAIDVPWMIFLSQAYQSADPLTGMLSRGVMFTVNFIMQILWFAVTPWIVLPLLAAGWAWFRNKRRPTMDSLTRRNMVLLALFTVFTLLILAPTSPGSFVRYLAPVLPVVLLMVARAVHGSMKVHFAFGIVMLIGMSWYLRMPSYLYEITHDYDGPVEGIVKYLNANARPGDVVATTYEDLPVKFYTKLRVVGGLTGEDPSPVKSADWVIMRQYMPAAEGQVVQEYFADNVPWNAYTPIPIPYPDLAFENREDPGLHFYATVRDEAPVVIWRRTGP